MNYFNKESLLSIFILIISINQMGFSQIKILLPQEKSTHQPNKALQGKLNNSKPWIELKNKGWRAVWNEQTKTPHRAWGKPIKIEGYENINRENVRIASLDFLKRYEKSLSIDSDSLILTRAVKANGLWYVSFSQVFNKLDVLFSRVELRINLNAYVVLVGVDYFNNISISEDVDLSEEKIISMTNIHNDTAIINTVILPLVRNKKITYHRVVQFKDEKHKSISFVDTKTGKILWRKSTVCQAFSGFATGDVQETLATDSPKELSFSDMYYSINETKYTTDEHGKFEVDISGTSTLNATLEGPYVKINNASAQNAVISTTIEPDEEVDIKWDNTNSTKSERNAFYHINLAHDTLKAIDPNYTFLDYSLPVIVDKTPANCNPYYDQTAINFDIEGNGCVSGADIAMVVYHEYAHAIIDKLMISMGFSIYQNRAADEAQADVFSTMIENSPVFAPGFFGPGTSTRNLTSFKKYPNDVDPNSPHLTGLILSGAFWDLKERTSPELVIRLAHFAKYGAPDGVEVGQVFKDWFIEVLVADDDDNDLSNGTPHFEDINWAFERHGINIPDIIDNTEADINSFSLIEETSPANINISNQTIEIEVWKNTDLTNLIAEFLLSKDAIARVGYIEQKSGISSNDFSNPVIYEVTSEDGNTIKNWTVTVIESNDEITGINSFDEKSFIFYPNPFYDQLVIEIKNQNINNNSVQLMSASGKILLRKMIENNYVVLDLSEMATGLYILKLFGNNTTLDSKIIIKK